MKKYLYIMIFSILAVGCVTSCVVDLDDDDDHIECVLEGKFHDSSWSTRRNGSDDVPYYTMKFSGMNSCRVRHFITENVDIDIKAYYYVEDYDSGTCYYVISKNNHEYAYFRIIDRNTLLLEIDGKSLLLYKQ